MAEHEQAKLTDEPEEEVRWPHIGMNIVETAKALRISKRAAQDLLSSGRLPGRLVAGRWRVSPAALERFLDSYEYAEKGKN